MIIQKLTAMFFTKVTKNTLETHTAFQQMTSGKLDAPL